jgi:hypothetical protein
MSASPTNVCANRRVKWFGTALAVVIVAAAVVRLFTIPAHDRPEMYYVSYETNSGTAIVVLTNATSRTWLLPLTSAESQIQPSYWIVREKGLPGWYFPFDEERVPRRQSPNTPVTLTNVTLHPHRALTFFVPIREIHGLSKVGVKYQLENQQPPSSRLGRATADVLARLRRILHFQRATPDQGWCETALPIPP